VGRLPEKKRRRDVIVIHEIFGLTDWVRGVADQLAKEGFIALARTSSREKAGRRGHRVSGRRRHQGDPDLTPETVSAARRVRDYALKFRRRTERSARLASAGRLDELRVRRGSAEAGRGHVYTLFALRSPRTRRSAHPFSASTAATTRA